jgi:geranylgeranyl diphosphate synthase, type I
MHSLTPYTERITQELDRFLPDTLPMYGMLRYFSGFADETLAPTSVYGGKRFRSALTLMLADRYGALEHAVPAALSIEIFHNFTLIHDDIVDNDAMRRGRPTVWKLWGVPHAINSGDAQLVLAYRALEGAFKQHPDRGAKAQAFLSARYLEVAEGQYLDFTMTDLPLGDARVTSEAYFEMIRKKTSVLVGAAAKVAGIMAGVSEAECDALYAYGEHLGLAVQLNDDLLSIWGEEARTGKRAFGDIKERKKTLPVIWALEHADTKVKEMLRTAYAGTAPLSDREAEALAQSLESAGAKDAIKEEIQKHLSLAAAAAGSLSLPEEAKQALMALHTECGVR